MVIRRRNSKKDRQYNGQDKKDKQWFTKRTQRATNWATWTPL